MSHRNALQNATWAFVGFCICFFLVVLNHFLEIL